MGLLLRRHSGHPPGHKKAALTAAMLTMDRTGCAGNPAVGSLDELPALFSLLVNMFYGHRRIGVLRDALARLQGEDHAGPAGGGDASGDRHEAHLHPRALQGAVGEDGVKWEWNVTR